MREPLFAFLLLINSMGPLSAHSLNVSGSVMDAREISLASANISNIAAEAGAITTAIVKQKSRSSNNSGVYFQITL